MDQKDKKETNKATVSESLEYPGVALNQSDKNKVTEELEKQSTKELNNNPRNNDM
ncbi:hypothetical protein [uncultured Duncaniella sp.]|uniref:hypothetical protein n=1 Tax=uncultured Duncaniella sp. TaxID=2768039 RepID=UPI0026E3083D|nr:hypothetical protein [uncultured Duncaniella sp.]